MRTIGDYGVFDPNVAFDALIRTAQYDAIPPEDCRIGFAYWGVGRSIGAVAVCRNDNNWGVVFEGLRNKLGEDYLFREVHHDVDEFFGTWRPLVELEPTPEDVRGLDLMDWLLEKEVAVAQERLDWLTSMPERVKRAKDYRYDVEFAEEVLDELTALRQNGFSLKRTIDFKAIVENARH